MVEKDIPDYCRKPILILGCGNILRGDDGFGPKVIALLVQRHTIPSDVFVLDAGTGVGEILLDLALVDEKPKMIILVDVLDQDAPPGVVSIMHLAELAKTDRKYVSSHQAPTSKLLRELESLGCEVVLITVQPESIPDLLSVGLSPPIQNAASEVCELIAQRYLLNSPA